MENILSLLKNSPFSDLISKSSNTEINFLVKKWKTLSLKPENKISSINNEILYQFRGPNHFEVDEVISAAREGLSEISNIECYKRFEMLTRCKRIIEENFDLIAKVIVMDSSKPINLAKREIESTLERLSFLNPDLFALKGEYIPSGIFAELGDRSVITLREPYGVAVLISPFNFPFFLHASKLTAALIAGNSTISIPSEHTPLSVLLLVKIFEMAGFPKNTLTTIATSQTQIKERIVNNQDIDLVSLTGSSKTGESVIRSAGIKKLHLELGGKAFGLALKDANPERVVECWFNGTLKNAGQRCDALNVILIPKELEKSLLSLILDRLKTIKRVDPFREDCNLGPLISLSSANRLKKMIKEAIDQDCEIILSERIINSYFPPHIIKVFNTQIKLMTEEIFGPIFVYYIYKDLDEAISIINSCKYGLDLAIFGEDINYLMKLSRRLKAGQIHINDYPRHGTGYYPVGGVKSSGTGSKEGIFYTVQEMSYTKAIILKD
ncbi:nonphosphorylating glyceraldehyde-3-phosphate dehydrogenase [Thermodesulfobium acidiphilum]|uniref:Nonphosphorylating glyceraldehyde-3-phosphate dehydrogenase n=1 Tax=Thermodesulfobium acidiphilum TaxID=1794699 RepID=A0A2R4VYS0_THEAF|nr:aldehyde dehydrogenase family protein [Thermodesulfobium acidiphilum]AWB09689.1 nonphosphorylating glyceraldehyde-3-phosphate dehydrogenase [Thermodesulfobium acidiphilum]